MTLPEEPLNESAPPYLPLAVQVAPAPATVPWFPLPEASLAVAPAPSLKAQAPTRPVGTGVELKVAV